VAQHRVSSGTTPCLGDAAVVAAPFGLLVIRAGPKGLVSVDISLQTAWRDEAPPTPLLREAVSQFRAYFRDAAFAFSLPLDLRGTAYQRRVWEALVALPAGTTRTYGGLATFLDSGARAVAAACRANPLPLIIPCHRIVGSHGLGGYCGSTSGPWLAVKRWLLRHESACCCDRC
jgi:methylated-DNA-[protein]-cysteine S-methyltransferase